MKRLVPLILIAAATVTVAMWVPTGQAVGSPVTLEVTAKRFAFSPAEVTLKKGQPAVLHLRSEDVAHGLKFPELHLHTRFSKDQSSELTFTPDRTGTFVGKCSVFCGSGHAAMTLILHVVQ